MVDDIGKSDIGNAPSRRRFITTASVGAAVAFAGCTGGDSGNDGGAVTGSSGGKEYADTLNMLMWPYYDLDVLNEPLEEEFGISVQASYFDGNSEVYNQLRTGGTEEFDIVMADSFWPRQYYNEDLIQPVDQERLNLDSVFPAFHPDNLDLHIADDGSYLGPPNAWGGYGMTYHPDKIAESDMESFMSSIFNEKYSGHMAASARPVMNIANTALALGYDDPKGNIWDVCSDNNLQEIANMLTQQKSYLITRFSDSRNLDRMYNSGSLWLFPEFSDAYRRLAFKDEPVRHRLKTEEGGLGWLEAWMITSGVESEAKKNSIYAFLNKRLEKQPMKTMAEEVGGAPAVDIRDMWSEKRARVHFQNRTDVFSELTQFNTPGCPEKWNSYWTEIQSA
jgi:spermidine/putrescine-binding protein